MIAANTTFLQCEQGYLCTAADNRPCLIDSCCKEACVEKCQKANSSCKFVERVGCHGVLQCHVAVRFGKTPAESEAVWLWGDATKDPLNVITCFELRQLATVFGLSKVKASVLVRQFTLQMSLDPSFEGIVVLTPVNAPLLMTPGTSYVKRRNDTLQELELVKTCLGKIEKICCYVYDNLACTTDEAPFNELVRDVDADLVYGFHTCSVKRIHLNLGLASVSAKLDPAAAMHPLLKEPEICHCFNTWMQLPQVDSPMYHHHQKFVDRIAPLLLENYVQQQKRDEKQANQEQQKFEAQEQVRRDELDALQEAQVLKAQQELQAQQEQKPQEKPNVKQEPKAKQEHKAPPNDKPLAKRTRRAVGGSA